MKHWIRLLDLGPEDGRELEVEALPKIFQHLGRKYIHVGISKRGHEIRPYNEVPCVVYVWEDLYKRKVKVFH